MEDWLMWVRAVLLFGGLFFAGFWIGVQFGSWRTRRYFLRLMEIAEAIESRLSK